MRSPLWFVVAGVIAIGGLVAAGFPTLSHLKEIDRQIKPVHVPGSVSIRLEKPGTYTIFHEEQTPLRGESSVPGLGLQLIEESSGEAIALTTASTRSSYEIAGRFGASMLSFTITHPGIYRLTSTLAYGRTATLAIAQGAIRSIFRVVFGTLGIAFAGFGIAGAIVGVTIWQRMKATKA